jgi:hypothetical protein
LIRWSTACAGAANGAVHVIGPGPSSLISMDEIGGQASVQWSSPSFLSSASAEANMHWLDSTGPDRISSGDRSLTSVTSCPAWRRPSAS